MVLSANTQIDRFPDVRTRTVPVKAATNLFKGAVVGLDGAGYARGLVAGDKFLGLAYKQANNSAGSAGDVKAEVETEGDFQMALSGAAVTDIGRPVFASADDTLTFAAVGNSYVGTVVGYESSGVIVLRLDGGRRAIKTKTYEVEDLDAGGDVAARCISEMQGEGWITAARIVNHDDAAAGVDADNTCVVALTLDGSALASKTYNAVVTFPAANAADSLGAVANNHYSDGDLLDVSVTNGATANPGAFAVEVDYV